MSQTAGDERDSSKGESTGIGGKLGDPETYISRKVGRPLTQRPMSGAEKNVEMQNARPKYYESLERWGIGRYRQDLQGELKNHAFSKQKSPLIPIWVKNLE